MSCRCWFLRQRVKSRAHQAGHLKNFPTTVHLPEGQWERIRITFQHDVGNGMHRRKTWLNWARHERNVLLIFVKKIFVWLKQVLKACKCKKVCVRCAFLDSLFHCFVFLCTSSGWALSRRAAQHSGSIHLLQAWCWLCKSHMLNQYYIMLWYSHLWLGHVTASCLGQKHKVPHEYLKYRKYCLVMRFLHLLALKFRLIFRDHKEFIHLYALI